MIKIKEAIIVEGKYDKIKLSSIIDGTIIETNGFRIFKDKNKLELIKRLAETNGILIFTDSDSAGFLIRNHIKSVVPEEKIKHAYIPDIYGKEKRKSEFSKEGKLGVEGVPKQVIIESLRKAGVLYEDSDLEIENKREITMIDLYELGLVGKDNSSEIRKKLLAELNLPEYMSVKALIKVLNCTMSYDALANRVFQIALKD